MFISVIYLLFAGEEETCGSEELLTKADGVSDKQAATIAKVHELMSQVEHLDDTVEHVAIRRKQLAEAATWEHPWFGSLLSG